MNETLLKASKKRILFSNLLESIFLFLSSLILVFAVGMPIVNNNSTYQNALTNNVTYKDNMLEIGTSSKLFFYNEEFNNISTLDSIYYVYVIQNIKMCYEEYGDIYKEELDNYGYSTKKDFMDNFLIASYETDFLGYFYTSFILNKVDTNDELLVNYNTSYNGKFYYVNNVLKINEEGKEFFTFDNNYDKLPRLNVDICRYLFQYHVMDVSYSTLREVDASFYNYFKEIYSNAGDLLLKYKDYQINFNLYNETYEVIHSYKMYAGVFSFLISFVIFECIFPIFNKNKVNPSNLILSLARLNNYKDNSLKIILVNMICSLFKYFYISMFILLILGGINTLNFTLIEVGVFTISTYHLSVLSLFLGVISILTLTINKNNKGLSSLISKSIYFEKFIS
ncbi:MAG: hypothetical protein SO087_04535 [Candidatus Onthovivens sp.]|nr:hypothetical protein [Candidatus Onthovivens sp.]